ncbi:unnamed protein product [Dibothriocephalus latus]|uniref:Exonuclease domain-containing protein n=1 Tax=Dibothriocephalus latus TaxID=60516 RepID=A0A3P7LM39_DIBLA|nr:unnamed protein product [Dibothriocephalus latus]
MNPLIDRKCGQMMLNLADDIRVFIYTQTDAYFSTFVFMDIGTTGLPTHQFHPNITELSLLAISRDALEDEKDVPRYQNKLVLCFHPRGGMRGLPAKISRRSCVVPYQYFLELNYKNLCNQEDFDVLAVEEIQLFLRRLEPPICLIAHNGFKFDFPILNSKIWDVKGECYRLVDSRGEEVACADTLHFFRAFPQIFYPVSPNYSVNLSTEIGELQISPPVPEDAPSTQTRPFALENLYTNVFGEPHHAAHTAEGDCIAMIRLVRYLGSCAFSWFDSTHRRLSHIR